MLLRALEDRNAPCVLELERAADPGSADLLGFLLAAAPPCLHLALADRRLLDLALSRGFPGLAHRSARLRQPSRPPRTGGSTRDPGRRRELAS